MQVMNNPVTSDAYRVWYHIHGKLFIGNPEHRQDQGYVQCGASLNEAMHYICEMHISTGEAREDRARALDLVRELHISSHEHLERAGYAYYADVPPHLFNDAPVYEPRVQHRRPDLRRHRENMRGQPGRGGRRMRAVNQALQAEGGDQNYDSQPFTMSGPSSSFCGPYSQADFGGLSQYTPASQVYDPSQPGSSHHNAPSNIIPQFVGQNRSAYNTSPWSHPVRDFIVEDSSSQPGIGSQNIGRLYRSGTEDSILSRSLISDIYAGLYATTKTHIFLEMYIAKGESELESLGGRLDDAAWFTVSYGASAASQTRAGGIDRIGKADAAALGTLVMLNLPHTVLPISLPVRILSGERPHSCGNSSRVGRRLASFRCRADTDLALLAEIVSLLLRRSSTVF
nr:serine/threonine-protein phosphatase 7 long form homolog [Ipomoea batatas]